MKILVTGSAGHLGEALMRSLADSDHQAIGLDVRRSAYTQLCGSSQERGFVKCCMSGVDVVLHTATLHKPHIASHTRQDFVDTNITGTLHLLEEAVSAGVKAFVYTSTTSVFGDALTPPAGAPAAWITEDVTPIPKNIYGVTKLAAENLCELFQKNDGISTVVLRASRFFPEEDDDSERRRAYDDTNLKVNELLYRRADIADVVSAHLIAMQNASAIGFGRFIISATTPFSRNDLQELRTDVPAVLNRYVPQYESLYRQWGWTMLPSIDRVYVNDLARSRLGWQPRYDFGSVVARLRDSEYYGSDLARAVGSKGYHGRAGLDGM